MHSWDFVGLRERDWVELPTFDEIQASPYFGTFKERLKADLDAYHKLDKTSVSELIPRRKILEDIFSYWKAAHWPDGLDRWARWLSGRLQNKARHLAALEHLLREHWPHPEMLKSWHCAESSDLGTPLVLTQKLYVCPERGSYWGDYWLQSLDPCHRYLPELQRQWRMLPEPKPPYPLWLEHFSYTEAAPFFYYFNETEKAQTRLRIIDGKLCQQSGRPLHCSERQHYLFVIDLDGSFYAAREAAHLCHASFTRGRAVLGSGILQAREGTLVHLKFESGHYLSALDEWQQALRLLAKAGIHWPEGTRLTVFDRYRYISRRVGPEILTHWIL